MLFNIAIKNLLGAGLRTWLNVFVTSLSLFMIIFFSGMYDGMRAHSLNVTIKTEFAGGSYWHPNYDPTDPMTFEDSHGPIPDKLQKLINDKEAFSVLVSQATIYPDGRMIPVFMKGISSQCIIDMPTSSLSHKDSSLIPILIGKGMADYAKLSIGDTFIIRWLDINKTYDAAEGVVVEIMNTENFQIDNGHIWLPLDRLQGMMSAQNHATYVTHSLNNESRQGLTEKWVYRDLSYLTRDMEALIEADEPNAAIIYAVMLCLAGMGIFNAQVLSIFKRTKEIGTLLALGMTRNKVIALFTLEGALNALFASLLTLMLFGPILWYYAVYGIPLPLDYSEIGMIIPSRLIPVYSIALIIKSTLIIYLIVLIVSYIPSRKISKVEATDALRGKVNI